MIFRRILLLITAIAATLLCADGQRRFTGMVSDAVNQEPLPAISARIIDGSGKIRKFATTKADGIFSIALPDSLKGLSLQLAGIGYQQRELPLDSIPPGDTLRVSLEVKSYQLKEVGIRAKRIYEEGDTVSYAVGQFTRKQDRSIGEVMNRMPGIDVSASGKVKYQGTDINKLYVEGTDMTGGAYGVVTTNLQAADVSTVEVLENHQPMQVLRGISFSDKAAINLRLKEKSRTKVMAHGSLQAGYGEREHLLSGGDLFLMTVKDKVKNITNLQANNEGSTLGIPTAFFGNDGGESLRPYSSIGTVGGSSKALFNRSANITTNTTWKTLRGAQWLIKGGYAFNHITDRRMTTTTYLLPTGDKVVTEDRHGDKHTHAASLSLNYELNEKRYYLNNQFDASGNWSDTRLDITGSVPNNQRLNMPDYEIVNRLKVIRRFGERRIVTFNSINQWLSRPERLSVVRSDPSMDYGSHIGQHAFFTDERAAYGLILGRVVVSLEGGLAGFFRHLDSSAGELPVSLDEPTANDLSTNYFKLFIQPKFELNLKRLALSLYMPLSYYNYYFGDALRGRNELFAAPRLSAQWRPNKRHTLNLSASARRSPASLHNIHRGVIMDDYRSFNAGVDDYYSSTGQNIEARWEWKNISGGLFGFINGQHSWARSKTGIGQMLVGDYVVNYYYNSPSSSSSTNLSGRLEKSIDAIASTLTLNASASQSSGSYMSQGNPVENHTRGLSVGPSCDMRFASWLNGSYSFTFATQRMALTATPHSRNADYNHSLSLSATPKGWIFSVQGYHTRTRIPGQGYDNRMDLSARVRCRLSSRLDLGLTGSNLLDNRTSVRRNFNTFSSYESISFNRGREVVLSLFISR